MADPTKCPCVEWLPGMGEEILGSLSALCRAATSLRCLLSDWIGTCAQLPISPPSTKWKHEKDQTISHLPLGSDPVQASDLEMLGTMEEVAHLSTDEEILQCPSRKFAARVERAAQESTWSFALPAVEYRA